MSSSRCTRRRSNFLHFFFQHDCIFFSLGVGDGTGDDSTASLRNETNFFSSFPSRTQYSLNHRLVLVLFLAILLLLLRDCCICSCSCSGSCGCGCSHAWRESRPRPGRARPDDRPETLGRIDVLLLLAAVAAAAAVAVGLDGLIEKKVIKTFAPTSCQ